MGMTTTEANATLSARLLDTTKYLALFTVAPTDAGGGTEVSGGSYARQAIAFTAPASRATSNSANIEYPEATGSWGTVVAGAIMSASSGGSMLWWDTVGTEQAVVSGNIYRISAGDLDVTLNVTP